MSSVLLFIAGRNKVVLMWVSGHQGISGMEAVDGLVRAGLLVSAQVQNLYIGFLSLIIQMVVA